jgi:hypothetical protein
MPRKSMRWQADLPPTASRPRRRPRDFSPRWRKLTLMYQTVGLGQCAGFGRRQLSYIFFLALGVTSSIVLVGPVLRQHWHGMEKSCLAAWLDGVDHRDAGPLYKSASIEGRGYAGIRSRSTRRRHRRRRALRRAKKHPACCCFRAPPRPSQPGWRLVHVSDAAAAAARRGRSLATFASAVNYN